MPDTDVYPRVLTRYVEIVPSMTQSCVFDDEGTDDNPEEYKGVRI